MDKVLWGSLTLLELGKEVDHYVGESYQASGHWDTTDYNPHWRNLSEEMLANARVRAAARASVGGGLVLAMNISVLTAVIGR